MAFREQKEKALALRKIGKGIGEISKELRVSKSTVSYWCRDIKLSIANLNALKKRASAAVYRGSLIAAEKKRTDRKKRASMLKAVGKHDVGSLSRRDRFVLGLALYWGEGFKKGNEEVGISNSDPAVITAFIYWVVSHYRVKRVDLIARVTINILYKDQERRIKKYWTETTSIPLDQFTRSSFISIRSAPLRKAEQYMGTLRVKVRRGTSLHRRIMGSIGYLQSSFSIRK
jgi:hypothetical protein